MICLQVINLLPENQRPQILAQEFDHVQCLCKSRSIPRESNRPQRHHKRFDALERSSPVPALCTPRQRTLVERYRSPLDKPLANSVAQCLQSTECGLPVLFLVHKLVAVWHLYGKLVCQPVGHGHHLNEKEV